MFNLRTLQRNKTVKYGVPMLLLVVGGFFGLPEFTQIRYDAQKLKTKMDPALEAKVNMQRSSWRRSTTRGRSILPATVCLGGEKEKDRRGGESVCFHVHYSMQLKHTEWKS
uniref:Cytochrome c oxidase assembly protein COX16 homolog, mitochondrial n=1 Tax=Amphiprion percula TaxID=161767 RepID=A0A3P8U6Y0_AMPPE